MNERYEHLGQFAEWVREARTRMALHPEARPGPDTQRIIRGLLGFDGGRELPADVHVERRWTRDGLQGEELSWSTGYGPRTAAWLLKPAGVSTPLPGVLALHCHSGFKRFGREKVADGFAAPPPSVLELRREIYGGRAFANELARRGFAVLVHDTFLWGSRRFSVSAMPASVGRTLEDYRATRERSGAAPDEVELYNVAADHHEHVVAKYCSVLGTTLAGVVADEDRIAARYLLSRPDVRGARVGCVGLSGGGCRAALLQATCKQIGAAVVAGMMTTHEELLDRHVASHTWMFLPPGLARRADWPDLAACRAPSPLLVQYNRDDHLFTLAGMEAAHRRIAAHYAAAGGRDAYTGQFYPGPHKFDLEMQDRAFAWLLEHLEAR